MAIPGPAENRIVTKPGDETAGSDATRAFIPPTPAPSGVFPFTGAPPAAGAPPLDPAERILSPRTPSLFHPIPGKTARWGGEVGYGLDFFRPEEGRRLPGATKDREAVTRSRKTHQNEGVLLESVVNQNGCGRSPGPVSSPTTIETFVLSLPSERFTPIFILLGSIFLSPNLFTTSILSVNDPRKITSGLRI